MCGERLADEGFDVSENYIVCVCFFRRHRFFVRVTPPLTRPPLKFVRLETVFPGLEMRKRFPLSLSKKEHNPPKYSVIENIPLASLPPHNELVSSSHVHLILSYIYIIVHAVLLTFFLTFLTYSSPPPSSPSVKTKKCLVKCLGLNRSV